MNRDPNTNDTKIEPTDTHYDDLAAAKFIGAMLYAFGAVIDKFISLRFWSANNTKEIPTEREP